MPDSAHAATTVSGALPALDSLDDIHEVCVAAGLNRISREQWMYAHQPAAAAVFVDADLNPHGVLLGVEVGRNTLAGEFVDIAYVNDGQPGALLLAAVQEGLRARAADLAERAGGAR